MFLSIKVFEDLCASIFGKDLEKIIIPEIQLHEAFSMVPFFSPMFVNIVVQGESSGHLSSRFARFGIQNQESLK